MSLATDKRDTKREINRYITLLSNLSNSPMEYIESLQFMLGLIDTANKEEMESILRDWQSIRPNDSRSVTAIKTGAFS